MSQPGGVKFRSRDYITLVHAHSTIKDHFGRSKFLRPWKSGRDSFAVVIGLNTFEDSRELEVQVEGTDPGEKLQGGVRVVKIIGYDTTSIVYVRRGEDGVISVAKSPKSYITLPKDYDPSEGVRCEVLPSEVAEALLFYVNTVKAGEVLWLLNRAFDDALSLPRG